MLLGGTTKNSNESTPFALFYYLFKIHNKTHYLTMPPYGEPDWATPGDTSAAPAPAPIPQTSAVGGAAAMESSTSE